MVQTFKDGINKDNGILDGYRVYLGNGQGCGTVWFKSVPISRKALKKDGIKTGRNFADCRKCRCSHSAKSSDYYKYEDYLCYDAKMAYAESFE